MCLLEWDFSRSMVFFHFASLLQWFMFRNFGWHFAWDSNWIFDIANKKNANENEQMTESKLPAAPSNQKRNEP